MSEPLPPVPRGRADVRPDDGPQDVPQDPGSVVETEVPDPPADHQEEAADGDR